MSDSAEDVRAYTIRLELVDRPGELLRALEPIAEQGGNLLSIFHERGNLTPRGDIPVEVDLEATPETFEEIVAALRDAGITVVQAGAEKYSEELTVILVGHLVNTDLSDTLSQIQEATGSSVRDFSLSAPEGEQNESSARLRLATQSDQIEELLVTLRTIADTKDLRVVEPLPGGETA
jgi:ACT domain-containing protein